ncbi:DNA metabolism protein [Lithospermum erythrorhizon]|uniref:DNA metabolism protein n=1 Tax=Lithospermum erythrorhizon TaxID=34254 RepID=A0AAV3PZF4_LITER
MEGRAVMKAISQGRLRWRPCSSYSGAVSSSVYQNALKFQKPTSIKYVAQPVNSASFIGRIAFPIRKSKAASLGVFTYLLVDSSPVCRCSFNVLLKMWDEMAELALEHLKPNDLVYVWGHLGSFTKQTTHYQLIVKDINFVTPIDQDPASTLNNKLVVADEDWKDKYSMKLHLWQVFFSNPLEWRDLRKCKKNPRQPDFRHKDTGEALWLSHNDPPWIQRQLQLHDSRMGGLNFEGQGDSSSTLSRPVSDFGKYI